MKRAKLERSIVVLLFISVLVIFSFAERDSKKLDKLYTQAVEIGKKQFLAKQQPSAHPTDVKSEN